MTHSWTWSALLLVGALLAGGVSYPRVACAEEEDIPLLPGSDPDKPLPGTDVLEAQQPKDADKERMLEQAVKWVELSSRFGASQVEGFDNRMAVQFAVVPEAALTLTRGIFVNMKAIHKAEGNLGPLADGCLVVAILLDRRKDQTDEIKLASAFGRLAHTWGRSLTGDPVDGSRVAAAASLVQTNAGDEPVSRPTWLAFVQAALKGSIVSPTLAAWVDAEVARLAAESPESQDMTRLAVMRDLVQAMRLTIAADKAGPAALTKVLVALAPEPAIRTDDSELTGLYNQAISTARRLKVSVKASYRSSKATSSTGLVTFEYPRAMGWVHVPGDGDQVEGTWLRDLGKREQTTISIRKYLFTMDYVDADGKRIGGDNIGGRMKKELRDDQAKMKKVRRVKDNLAKISRGLPDVRGYELRGENEDGTEGWHREYFFKAEAKAACVNISVRREGQALVEDPEIEFILDSMEQKQKK